MTVLVCKNHPDRETGLRCKVCGEPICASCAVRTPTGYSCSSCVKGHAKKFETAEGQDYIIGFMIAAVLSAIGGMLVGVFSGFLGFWMIWLILPAAGSYGAMIAEAIRRATKKHRSKRLYYTVSAGLIVGCLPQLLILLFSAFMGGGLFGLLWPIIYLAILTPTVYARLSGIQISR